MKLIADIGTNPDLIKIDVADVLLHHFLKHYSDLGVSEFILHGNDVIIDSIKPLYNDLYNINFVTISAEEFLKYRKRDCDTFLQLESQGLLELYHQQYPGPNICPLWIIQNDLKKQYLSEDELCFILDLDEFVELSATELASIHNSDIEYCSGTLVDRVGYLSNELVSLNKDINIFRQLDQQINITKSIANRATNKIIITRGHLESCFGHHGLYKKSDAFDKKKWPQILNVWHCKYFKQNIDGGLGRHGIKEQEYFKTRNV
jgi:hypothetical protein